MQITKPRPTELRASENGAQKSESLKSMMDLILFDFPLRLVMIEETCPQKIQG